MSRVGPYEIVLSVAGTSRLAYLARRRDESTGREFILIPLELSGDDALRLEDELARCRKVNHQAIATVFELFEHEGSQVLAFDRFGGTNLRRLWHYLEETGGALSDRAALHLGFVLFDALAAAHEATDIGGLPLPIVHGHLGPHQVLISSGGAVSVFGFGLARPYELARSRPGPSDLLPFVAPENRAGAAPSPASNVYSAAATVWALLVGRPPSIDQRPAAVAKLRPDLPQDIALALDRALQPVAALRSITSRELAIAFAQSSDSHGPRELGKAMAACRREADVDAGFIPPESLPPRLSADPTAPAGDEANAEQRRSTWTTSSQPELSPAEQQAVARARRRSGRSGQAAEPLQGPASRSGGHAKVRSAARRRGVTMPGSRRSPLADLGSAGPRSRSAKRRALARGQHGLIGPESTPAPHSGPSIETLDQRLPESEPIGSTSSWEPDAETERAGPESAAAPRAAELVSTDSPAEPVPADSAAPPSEDGPASSPEPVEVDYPGGPAPVHVPEEPAEAGAPSDQTAPEPAVSLEPSERVHEPTARVAQLVEPTAASQVRGDGVDGSATTDEAPRPRRLPVKWLVAAVLLAFASFVTGLIISIGPVSVHFGHEPAAAPDSADAAPPSRAAPELATSGSSRAGSFGSSLPTPVPTVAPPPTSAPRPTAPTSEPVGADEGSVLPPDQGYLTVRSSAKTLHVYSNGQRAGPTNERLAVGCGMKHLRLGDRPLQTWHSKGRAVAVDCQSMTQVAIEPDPPQPVGGP